MPRLDLITLYPLKSLDGVEVAEARLLPSGGLEHDRRWRLVDMEGKVMNAKRSPLFAAIRAEFALDERLVSLDVDPAAIAANAIPGIERLGSLRPGSFHLLPGRDGPCGWLSEAFGIDLLLEERDAGQQVTGVALESGEVIRTRHVVLAIGHSARETFAMLEQRGVHLEAKPFSIGVRIEHPQSLIDQDRWGAQAGNRILGAAEYRLVHHASNGRTAYSFCMCPGGTVVAATSEPGRVVTNGMSQYSRAERNANSGLVVDIAPADYPGGLLQGVAFQRHWEERAFIVGGSNYKAPAQRVGDFLAGQASTALGSVIPSYRPGVTPTDITACLPDFAVAALREAIPAFDKQIKGYAMDDAVMTAVETRTSAPVRITRDAGFQSLSTTGLYPAGEGAGYAGGILSAGVDGIKVAEAVGLSMLRAAYSGR
jgi:uncharacterized FAD-dependent dehydrogenase